MALAVASVFADLASAQVLPTGGSVTAGTATIGTSGSAMTVTTGQRAIIDWTTFNIGNGASVQFVQPGATSVAVNRVGLSGGASAINGALNANGNVMILNPNGVMFGATAVVNVAGLIASTGNINDANFMNEALPIAITGATGASVSNAGQITVNGAGLAAFVAPSVSNSGHILAQSGRITLASAQAATVSFNGGLYEIALNQGINLPENTVRVSNTGTLSATGGTIVLSALDAANIVSGVINLSGVQQANRIEVHGDHVVLSSDLNATTVAGDSRLIDVCGCASIQDGVDIAKVGTSGHGAQVNVEGGTRSEQVTLNKAYLTLSGHDDATVTIGAGQTAFNIAADGVTVEGMKVVGPYSQPYTAVNWNAEPNITAAFTIQPNVSGATIRNNDLRNLRAGVLMLGAAPSARITGNVIDNTKGSILVRSNGATISGNSFGPIGNEWDIVFLNGVSDGAYFTSPHTSEAAYGAGVMAMSADNNGMHILDRRYGSNGLLGSTPQFGNRSHIVVSAGSSFTAADDFNLGNGLGNPRQPLGNLQAGIDAVVPGGFVDVKTGTYTLSSTLNVDKALTFTGAGEANTLIDARTVSGYGMLVTGDNVSLSDFTFYGPQANVGTSYGIKVNPDTGAASDRLLNFSISNVTSRGAGRAELDLNGVVGATIDHFTANGAPVGNDGGTTAGAGIQVTDSTNVTISNSTTRNNAWGGVAFYQANRFYNQQVASNWLQSNNTFNEANPLYMQDESASLNFGTNQLDGFLYSVRNTSSTNSNNQYTWLQYNLAGAFALATAVPVPLSSYIQGWTGTASTQNFQVGAGMSIMTAVNQASAGASVTVGAGTFAEQLTINKDLTLTGAGSASTFVQPTTLTADASGMRSIVTIGGGADVEVSGFTFRGPVPEINAGIFVRDGSFAHIHHNALVDIRESVALSGVQRGVGIFVGRASVGTSGNALIENNTITGYQKGGIVVDGPGSSATVQNNTVMGEGPTGVTAQNGIQVSRGASATITGNTVSGNNYTGADDAVGILIFTPGANLGQGSIVVGPNNVTANEVGVWTNDPATLATISLSGVTGNLRNGVADFEGGYAGGGALLEYPAWSASTTALVNQGAFSGAQTGDMLSLDGAMRVSGWNGFSAIQPAIDAVPNGGTVNVSSGTYAENVVVNGQRNLLFTDATMQSLTVNASGTGIGGNASATGPAGFMFNAPIVLLSHTTLSTSGANITFNADIQNVGTSPFDLTLSAGSGNILMVTGGSASNPLGYLDVSGNNYSLASTLWVTGYEIDAAGTVSLSTSTLRSVGGGSNSIDAGGDITGNTITEGPVDVRGGSDVVMKIVSTSTIAVEAPAIVVEVQTPAPVTVTSPNPPQITGSAPEVVVDAPGGTVSGSFGSVTNAGSGVLEVNGKPQTPDVITSTFDASRIVPAEGSRAVVATTGDGGTEVYLSTADEERRNVRIVRAGPQDAGQALQQGLGVDLDLSPRNRKPD